jgi:transposase-like protein
VDFSGRQFSWQLLLSRNPLMGFILKNRYQPTHKEVAKKLQIMPRQELSTWVHQLTARKKRSFPECHISIPELSTRIPSQFPARRS